MDELVCPSCGEPLGLGTDLECDRCTACDAELAPYYAAALSAAQARMSAAELRILFTVAERGYCSRRLPAHEAAVVRRYDILLAEAFDQAGTLLDAEPQPEEPSPGASPLDDVPMYPRWEFCRLELTGARRDDRLSYFDIAITYLDDTGTSLLLSESNGPAAQPWEIDAFDYAMALLGQAGWELVGVQYVQSGMPDDDLDPWRRDVGAVAHFHRPSDPRQRIDEPPLLLVRPEWIAGAGRRVAAAGCS